MNVHPDGTAPTRRSLSGMIRSASQDAIHQMGMIKSASREAIDRAIEAAHLDDPLISPRGSKSTRHLFEESFDDDALETPTTREITIMRAKTGSVMSSVYNLVATMIGGGSLSVPYAFRSSGLVLTAVMYVLLGTLSAHAIFLLLACKKFCEDEILFGRARETGGLTENFLDDAESGAANAVVDSGKVGINAGSPDEIPPTVSAQTHNATIRELMSNGTGRDADGELPTSVDSISAVARVAFGRRAEQLTSILLLTVLLLSLIAYFILLGDVLPECVAHFNAHPKFPGSSRAALTGMAAIAIFPVCLLRELTALRFNSLFSLAAVIFLALAITVRSVQANVSVGWKGHLDLAVPGLDILTSLVLVALSFLCHFNVLTVSDELGEPTRRKLSAVVFFTTAVPILVYSLIGAFGYLEFRESTTQDILSKYPPTDSVLFAGRIGLGIVLLLNLPLLVNPARRATQSLVFGECTDGWRFRVFATPIILFGSWGVSINITDVVIVWSFCGATIGLTVMFIIPPLCYLTLRSRRHCWVGVSAWLGDSKGVKASSMLIFGVFGVILCTVQAVLDLKNQEAS